MFAQYIYGHDSKNIVTVTHLHILNIKSFVNELLCSLFVVKSLKGKHYKDKWRNPPGNIVAIIF